MKNYVLSLSIIIIMIGFLGCGNKNSHVKEGQVVGGLQSDNSQSQNSVKESSADSSSEEDFVPKTLAEMEDMKDPFEKKYSDGIIHYYEGAIDQLPDYILGCKVAQLLEMRTHPMRFNPSYYLHHLSIEPRLQFIHNNQSSTYTSVDLQLFLLQIDNKKTDVLGFRFFHDLSDQDHIGFMGDQNTKDYHSIESYKKRYKNLYLYETSYTKKNDEFVRFSLLASSGRIEAVALQVRGHQSSEETNHCMKLAKRYSYEDGSGPFLFGDLNDL